ncbi:permease [Agaricicola taiwanensis]|uniref:Permease n=1 Tax=Agaricicola taiwanensis TaxID=591372 RepID=A0A8J3DU80_9RHOB|nr:DMT family transporter [Agaricicola taiwanensis]GGE42861.1 permease [Agaricicola taiwanensis]
MFAGIALKILAAFFFTLMAACIRWIGDAVPPGQVVFFRSFLGLLPIVVWLILVGELKQTVLTRNIPGHFLRSFIGCLSMLFVFSGLARLPLPDATVIGYAAPLITIVLAYFILKERIGIYRWSAVGVGLIGVLILLWPHLSGGTLAEAFGGVGGEARVSQGALFALAGAFCSACAMIQVRRLAQTEKAGAIVFYFSLFSAVLSFLSIPFGWVMPDLTVMGVLLLTGIFGGIGQLLMTQSYRYADASLIAVFEYTTIIWSVALGWALFGDVPQSTVYIGAAIIIGSGVYVIFREHRLGIKRARARKASAPPST